MSLLVMGEEYMVDINVPWVSTVPEFRALLLRDHGNKKDGPGRYKRKALRDFTFIYLMYDFDSDIREWGEEEKLAEACRRTDRQTWQVEQDEELQDAIRAYINIMEKKSSAYMTYQKLKRANENGLFFVENIDLAETTDNGYPKYKYKEISDAIKAQPAVEEALDKIRTLAHKQLSGGTGIRGENIKGYDEDPDM